MSKLFPSVVVDSLVCSSSNAWEKVSHYYCTSGSAQWGTGDPQRVFIEAVMTRAVVTVRTISKALLSNSMRSSGHAMVGSLPLQGSFDVVLLTTIWPQHMSRSARTLGKSGLLNISHCTNLYTGYRKQPYNLGQHVGVLISTMAIGSSPIAEVSMSEC